MTTNHENEIKMTAQKLSNKITKMLRAKRQVSINWNVHKHKKQELITHKSKLSAEIIWRDKNKDEDNNNNSFGIESQNPKSEGLNSSLGQSKSLFKVSSSLIRSMHQGDNSSTEQPNILPWIRYCRIAVAAAAAAGRTGGRTAADSPGVGSPVAVGSPAAGIQPADMHPWDSPPAGNLEAVVHRLGVDSDCNNSWSTKDYSRWSMNWLIFCSSCTAQIEIFPFLEREKRDPVSRYYKSLQPKPSSTQFEPSSTCALLPSPTL